METRTSECCQPVGRTSVQHQGNTGMSKVHKSPDCISPCKRFVIKFSFLTYRNRPNAMAAENPHILNLTIYLQNIPVGSGVANSLDVLTENLNALVRSHKDHGGKKKR